jgi:hypothetical protein
VVDHNNVVPLLMGFMVMRHMHRRVPVVMPNMVRHVDTMVRQFMVM